MRNNREKILCPVEYTLSFIEGKWKLLIIRDLLSGAKRTSELKKSISNITQKMLIQQLKEMEKDGLIKRKVYPVVPPKVEYSLTEFGLTLLPVIESMKSWGLNNMNND